MRVSVTCHLYKFSQVDESECGICFLDKKRHFNTPPYQYTHTHTQSDRESAYILSIALYGPETWAMNKDNEKRMKAFEFDIIEDWPN